VAALSDVYICVKVIEERFEENTLYIISTDEDPGLRSESFAVINGLTNNPGLRSESFAVINLRGVSTNKTIILNTLIN
jgi:hypothetical protein